MTERRLVAVFGYSDGGDGLHEICRGRLLRAQAESRPGDVVLLSGWARGRSAASEAELMARAWRGRSRRVVLDRDARSTAGNVASAARLTRSVGAEEVVLATSGWHAPRAAALLRVALRGTGASVRVVTTDEPPPAAARLRELLCWAIVPVLVLGAGRDRYRSRSRRGAHPTRRW